MGGMGFDGAGGQKKSWDGGGGAPTHAPPLGETLQSMANLPYSF